VVPPTRFLRLVEHIRTRFDADEALCANLGALCDQRVPQAVRSAAAATLVNNGFLKWTGDARLIRADAQAAPPPRRTA
jgi:hypothetical protein